MQFRVLTGDLSEWKCDAIIHSASSTLLATNPLSNKLQQKGGLSYSAACRTLGMCHVGSAVMTKGYKLKIPYVIHAVGPYWVGGKRGEEGELLDAYKKALKLAEEKKLKHLAAASLSTSDKRYPLQQAASAVVPVLFDEGVFLDRLDLVCENAEEQEAYTKAAVVYWLQKLAKTPTSERSALAEEAATALALIQCKPDTPKPDNLTALSQKIKTIITAFLRLKRRSLISVEHSADKIMDLYAAVDMEDDVQAVAAEVEMAVKPRKTTTRRRVAKKTTSKRGSRKTSQKEETVGQAIAAEEKKEETAAQTTGEDHHA